MTADGALSSPDSARGRMQRIVLALLREHEAEGELPTNGRFVFYELEGKGVVRKSERGESRRGSVNDPREQEVTDALTQLRDRGIVPWNWIVDETRVLHQWECADTVADFARRAVDYARINPWVPGDPPLLLVESRSLGGVLRSLAAEYVSPLAATNGQVGGFLRTDIAPVLADDKRPVLYLGDLDLQGDQIEANTRRVLEHEVGYALDWTRIAITDEQVAAHALTPVWKVDNRYRPPRECQAVETEALGQRVLTALVRDALDGLLPEPLARVQEREAAQRTRVAALLAESGSES